MKYKRIFPFLDWLPAYRLIDLRSDLIAGLTVAVMLVPQGMAYGLLAGLPPIYGLYSAIVPLLLYAVFGTSRQLSVGPVALVSLLVLAGVSKFAEPGSSEFVSLAITTALIAGLIQLILGFLRLGFLVNFLSHPVISGFTSAAALIIAGNQIANLLGMEVPRTNEIQELVVHCLRNAESIHLPTAIIGISGIVLIVGLRKMNRLLPGALIAVILGIVVTLFFHLDRQEVEVLGQIPRGLPQFEIPYLDWEVFVKLLPLSATICLISFIESLAIAKKMEYEHQNYRVIPNQELIALGISKLGGAFFQSYPTTGSFARSAINNENGAKSTISSIVASILISLFLLFLTPYFYYLPKAILASVIIVAVRNLFDIKEAANLWKTDKRDFLTLMATFVVTIFFGIMSGVFTGVLLSLAIVIYRNSKPHIAILGRLPNTQHYRNVERFEDTILPEDTIILRFDAQLYFGNIEYFKRTIETLVREHPHSLKLFILDASSVHDVDSSGIHALKNIIRFFQDRGIVFYVTGVIGPVRDIFQRNGMTELIGHKNQFLHVHDAIQHYQEEADHWNANVLQNNIKQSRRKM